MAEYVNKEEVLEHCEALPKLYREAMRLFIKEMPSVNIVRPPKMGSIERPQTGICAKCGRADCDQQMEHIDNCNGYIEPQTEKADRIPFDPSVEMGIKRMVEERLAQTERKDK